MGFWSGGAIDYGISADRPRVELRKRRKNGCADRNWIRLTDAPNVPCFVCGHGHRPTSFGEPFCLYCAFAVMRENGSREATALVADMETLIRHGRH